MQTFLLYQALWDNSATGKKYYTINDDSELRRRKKEKWMGW